MESRLEIFKSGETIDLCLPTEEFAKNSEWYSWFNRPDLTRYLDQGINKNTPELQVEYFKNLSKDRIIFILQTKNHIPCGVISFSFINNIKKSAQFAIVKDNTIEPELKGISALESVALLIEHGFEDLNLKRITAYQHIGLRGWQSRLELLGFKLEGIYENLFVKGNEIANAQSITCIYDDYCKIKKFRNNKIWDSKIKMLDRINKLPKNKFFDVLNELFENEKKDYYEKIFSL